jgi:hypothetical protein
MSRAVLHRSRVRLSQPLIVSLACLALAGATAFAQAPATDAERDAAAEQSKRVAELEKSLSGCTLVGHFTVTGREEMTPREERYELASVKHLEGDMWLITARIKYGENDVTVPLPLPIRWAGDTPVITVDEFAIPGLGTYTARVMIYRDHYAGFWTGADHGGHLFGTVERADAAGEEAASAAEAVPTP